MNPRAELRELRDESAARQGPAAADAALRAVAVRLARAAVDGAGFDPEPARGLAGILDSFGRGAPVEFGTLESIAGPLLGHVSWRYVTGSEYVGASLVGRAGLDRRGVLQAWAVAACAALYEADAYEAAQRADLALFRIRIALRVAESRQQDIAPALGTPSPVPPWDTKDPELRRAVGRVTAEFRDRIPLLPADQLWQTTLRWCETMFRSYVPTPDTREVVVGLLSGAAAEGGRPHLPAAFREQLERVREDLTARTATAASADESLVDSAEYELAAQVAVIRALLAIDGAHPLVACCSTLTFLHDFLVSRNTVAVYDEIIRLIRGVGPTPTPSGPGGG